MTRKPGQPPLSGAGSVRIVEVPNTFFDKTVAITGAILHPFSTTIVRVVVRESPGSIPAAPTVEAGVKASQSAQST